MLGTLYAIGTALVKGPATADGKLGSEAKSLLIPEHVHTAHMDVSVCYRNKWHTVQGDYNFLSFLLKRSPLRQPGKGEDMADTQRWATGLSTVVGGDPGSCWRPALAPN